MKVWRFVVAACCAVVMNVIGLFSVWSSKTVVLIGLPGALLGFTLQSDALLLGTSFAIWFLVVLGMLSVGDLTRRRGR